MLGQQLATPIIVFAKSISRRAEEHEFKNDESSVNPGQWPRRSQADPMADVGNRRGNKHICVELIVLVVNLDEKPECRHIS